MIQIDSKKFKNLKINIYLFVVSGGNGNHGSKWKFHTVSVFFISNFCVLSGFVRLLSSWWWLTDGENLVYIGRVLRHKRALSLSGVICIRWWKAPSTIKTEDPSYFWLILFFDVFWWWWLVTRLHSEWVDLGRLNLSSIYKCLISHVLNSLAKLVLFLWVKIILVFEKTIN